MNPREPGPSTGSGHRLFILNGPNLDMVGRREPHLYGRVTLAAIEERHALRMVEKPVVEVHLTNVFGREPLYRGLLTAAAAWGLLAGFGAEVYEMGMRGLATHLPEGGRPCG